MTSINKNSSEVTTGKNYATICHAGRSAACRHVRLTERFGREALVLPDTSYMPVVPWRVPCPLFPVTVLYGA
jgi:hypothetical protein